jgi:hypothetical protein
LGKEGRRGGEKREEGLELGGRRGEGFNGGAAEGLLLLLLVWRNAGLVVVLFLASGICGDRSKESMWERRTEGRKENVRSE